MSKILKVGMVQQSCGKDIAANIDKLELNIRDCAAKGAQLVVLQELHNSVYFCQTEEAAICDLAEPIPGPSTDRFGALAKELGVVIVLSLFERRAPGIYHNTAVVMEKTEPSPANTARCTSLTIHASTRNSTSPQETSASSRSIPRSETSVSLFVGINGTLKEPESWP